MKKWPNSEGIGVEIQKLENLKGENFPMDRIRRFQNLIGRIFCVELLYYHSPPINLKKTYVKRIRSHLFIREKQKKNGFHPMKFELQPSFASISKNGDF
jgi:hypothetical protein